MKTPKALYVLIGLFCVFAIIAGVYAQFIENKPEKKATTNNVVNNIVQEKDAQTIKTEFSDLFTNTINLDGIDTTGIAKNKEDKEIVYSAYDITKNEPAYEINIHIPVINIKSEIANSFNNITQATFINKANEILSRTDTTSKAIYSIDYVGYVNDNILSLVIRSTLKEGQSAQRIIIQTYNYNLSTNQNVTLNELITRKALNKEDVNNRIKTVVEEANSEAQAIQDMGYNEIFSRDLTNSIYTVDNASTFFLGNDNKLYIIYAYGNQNFTSEMDIILFE